VLSTLISSLDRVVVSRLLSLEAFAAYSLAAVVGNGNVAVDAARILLRTPAELAACASALVYESRQAEDAAPPKVPSGRTQDALAETVHLWGRLDLAEKDHGLSFQREPDLGFAWAAYRWASGQRLERVLTESGMQAGDFVRWTKQLADLLGQVADAAPAEGGVRQAAFRAVEAIRRGVVAYSSVG